ncbi:hypothetical protein [Methyloraptor flagellatus]|uniref:DUF4397 domain-containing protein n=1 Tax=Methyloraptor flagellatus TaxID=3162530 RepID=A0AAU7XC29_9HYPH
MPRRPVAATAVAMLLVGLCTGDALAQQGHGPGGGPSGGAGAGPAGGPGAAGPAVPSGGSGGLAGAPLALDSTAKPAVPDAAIPYAPNPAPAAPAAPPAPIEASKPTKPLLKLTALVTEDSGPIRSGLVWRIYKDERDGDDTRLKLLATMAGGDAEIRLDPGSYLVHAAYGRAGATTRVTIDRMSRQETLILNAGGLKLTASVAGDLPVNPSRVTFDIYSKDVDARGERQALVVGAKPGKVIRLNADTYHVVSHYGDLNAVSRAEIHVNPGKLTEATMYHKAAAVTFKLVAEGGGEALANTNWLVLTPSGDQITESVGAFPTVVLAEGEYSVVAKHNNDVYTRTFTVESGVDRDIEVLADKKQ